MNNGGQSRKDIRPAGLSTGKTTALLDIVEGHLKDNMDPTKIGFMAYTRAARREAKTRALSVFPWLGDSDLCWFRTLHSTCYRLLGLGRDSVVTTRKIREFSKAYGYEISGLPDKDPDDPEQQEAMLQTLGDYLLFFEDWRRNRMLWDLEKAYAAFPIGDAWPNGWGFSQVRMFHERYSRWKADSGLVDFADMVMLVLNERLSPDLDALIVDEVQDLSPLQASLVRMWAGGVRVLYLAADPDQAIYLFMGADPSIFNQWPATEERQLVQSHRVPRAIHRPARMMIRRNSNRVDVPYLPKDEEGYIKYVPRGGLSITPLYSEGSVLLLARNRYLLNEFIEQLVYEGLPFEALRGLSPLRASATALVLTGLRLSSGEKVSLVAASRFINSLESEKWLVRGAKTRLEELAKEAGEAEVALWDLDGYMKRPLWDMMCSEGASFIDVLKLSGQQKSYYTRLLERHGASVLEEQPRIKVGTIHCSPPDELVLLADGFQKPIGELNPQWDRLVSFYEDSNKMALAGHGPRRGRGKRGALFSKAEHFYEGKLVVIETSRSRCRVTPYHRVRVRYADAFYNKWVVYLMRRGDWWRIGVSRSACRPYHSGGVVGRLATEKADAAWLLGIYDTEREAWLAEAELQGRYGLPGITFEVTHKDRMLTSEDLHMVYKSLEEHIAPRVAALFADLGLYMDWPLYQRGPNFERRYMFNRWFETVAANLLDAVMEVPVWDRGIPPTSRASPDGERVRITREYYRGPVIGLEVSPYGHYVSGGQVVHNSAKGMEADFVVLRPDMAGRTYAEWFRDREGERRVWYVGVTRAKKGLLLMSPDSIRCIDWRGELGE